MYLLPEGERQLASVGIQAGGRDRLHEGPDIGSDRLALLVHADHFVREDVPHLLVFLQEEPDRFVRFSHPARRVYGGAKLPGKLGRTDPAAGEAEVEQEVGNAGAGLHRHGRESLPHDDAILVAQGHEVGQRAERRELQGIGILVASRALALADEGGEEVQENVDLADRRLGVTRDAGQLLYPQEALAGDRGYLLGDLRRDVHEVHLDGGSEDFREGALLQRSVPDEDLLALQERQQAGLVDRHHARHYRFRKAVHDGQVAQLHCVDHPGIVGGTGIQQADLLTVEFAPGRETEGGYQFVDDAATRQVAEGVRRARELGVHDGDGAGKYGRGVVVVHHDDVDSEFGGPVHLGDIRYPAIHGDDQGSVVRGEFLDSRPGQPVAFIADGYAPARVDADAAQRADEQGGARDAVHVPVTENEDFFSFVLGGQNAVHRVFHSRQGIGIAEVAGIVLQEVTDGFALRQAPAREYGGGEQLAPVFGRQSPHEFGRNVFLFPVHIEEISLRTSFLGGGASREYSIEERSRGRAAFRLASSLPQTVMTGSPAFTLSPPFAWKRTPATGLTASWVLSRPTPRDTPARPTFSASMRAR